LAVPGRAAAQRLDLDDIAALVAPRPPGVHKTSAGHVAIVAGSPGRIGAPQLAARGALRGGAGVATIATWPDSAAAIQSHLLEVMSARERANPGALRFAGRRRNMPSKSTIPASLSLSR